VLITNVHIAGRAGTVDVRCAGGRIAAVGPSLARAPQESVIDGAGAALLPGLHDHHIHLYALAARHHSVQCGPPAVCNRAQLARALRAQPGVGWIRGVGYHESVAGELDRWVLDAWVADRPVKIQHRSGKLWIVNSLAAQLLSLEQHAQLHGVALTEQRQPNGRLFRLDDWMREQRSRSAPDDVPSLAGISRQLASYGVTGVTDASPGNNAVTLRQLARAVTAAELLQNVRVMGAEDLPVSAGCAQLRCGERKVMLDEDTLPDWDTLCDSVRRSHEQGRAVAVHCVTAAELVFVLSVLRAVGPLPGDRIEHASLVPRDVLPLLREVGVRVVTQPGFIHERGDQYAQEVDPAEHGDLYRCRALLAQGIPLAGSTDAPYGDPDPWAAMRSAVQRSSRSGICLGPGERLSPEDALALFTSAADDPGGSSRTVSVGGPADLCLLGCRWEDARLRLRSEDVRATIRGGVLIYSRDLSLEESMQHAAARA
jgi:predicted amidohydrolase YtcJ